MGRAAALIAAVALAGALLAPAGPAAAAAAKPEPTAQTPALDAARAANRRGVELREKGDFAGALQAFSEAVRLAPDAPFGWFNLGLTRRDLKDCARAIGDFTRALELDAGVFAVWYQRGNCRQSTGAFEDAVSDYDRALRIPGRINGRFLAFFARGDANRRLGRLDRALLDYTATLQLRADTKALRSRAWTNAYLGRWQDAWEDASRYLHETQSKEADAPYVLLLAHAALERAEGSEKAAQFLAEAIEKIAWSGWPRPVVDLLRGTLSSEALEAAAQGRGQLTEARTWLGLSRLARRQTDAGTTALRWVVQEGRPGYWEYDLAFYELRRLGAALDAERRIRE